MATIANRIKELREKRGMTQDNLAEFLGMNRVNISNYERGVITNIPGDVLSKLADLFNTSVDYILGRTNDPIPDVHNVPDWATAKDKRDFKKLLEDDTEIMFDGVPLSQDDKQRVMDVLTGLFWEAKYMNKRKKKPDNKE